MVVLQQTENGLKFEGLIITGAKSIALHYTFYISSCSEALVGEVTMWRELAC